MNDQVTVYTRTQKMQSQGTTRYVCKLSIAAVLYASITEIEKLCTRYIAERRFLIQNDFPEYKTA